MKTVAIILTLLLMGCAVPNNDNKLPEWFNKKYSTPVPKTADLDLSAPVADTQEERERLTGDVLQSTNHRILPRHDTGIAKIPALSRLNKIRRPPVREESRRVFTDQRQMEEIIGGDPMALQRISFKGDFNRARNAGLEEFEYKAGRFTTQNKDETSSQWLTTLESNRNVDDTSTKKMIKQHEGFRQRQYIDAEGAPTIGYGHKIEQDEPIISYMTRNQADELFEKDYAQHKESAERIPGYNKANRIRKAALIDLTYNMGPTWYKRFPKFTAAFSAGKYRDAAKELRYSDWYKQTGRRAKKITNMIRQGN